MTVILLRHGRSVANARAQLAGRTPGIGLDETGRAQAAALVERLSACRDKIVAVARSPLQRCAETVAPLLASIDVPEIVVDDLVEVDYGEWTNQPIKDLLAQPLWKTVQQHPSAAVFPGGEGLAQVQNRAVAAIRRLDRELGGPDGDQIWVACSHGDVIKSVIADAMCSHLDSFQRIVVEPASMSVIQYHPTRPSVHTVNSTAVVAVPLPRPPKTEEAAAATNGHHADAIGGSTGSEILTGATEV
ncbi:MSMEG_4193 family putative phosphomutase [Gordonia sp. TBRC 11910]|uniref:MSMEG_4193 family putative phosphomutase n=1 Tax=Gordonia asplenii TaxID=2725283 RepID=A0A848KU47_9ACTN|nr:MSMEG_4193 family putative phosphomutase [Gordonia asplenii]NMO00395.1 MSMEG_4193 family putative phosphomutase [Gordonia asplenii]